MEGGGRGVGGGWMRRAGMGHSHALQDLGPRIIRCEQQLQLGEAEGVAAGQLRLQIR